MSGYALPVLAGALLYLCFPGPSLGWLAWVALVPLLLSVRGRPRGLSFRYGFAAGLAFNLLSVSWVAGTMSSYGGLPYPLSLALLAALSAYLSLYFGAFGWLMSVTYRDGRFSPFAAAPVYWVALELARNYMLSGFPWNLLGYSQAGFTHVIQLADTTGVYGVSALVVFVNAALAESAAALREKRRLGAQAVAGLAFAAVVVAAAIGYGQYRLSHPAGTGGSVRVALVQGNIDQFVKWDPAYQDEVFNTYAGLTGEAAKDGPDLVVWPETATPFYFGDREHWPAMEGLASKAGSFILTGSPAFEMSGDGTARDFNSAFLISPDGTTVGRYDKMHLVPFGEYVPLKKLMPFVSKMVTSIGDFGTGDEYTVLRTPHGSFGTAICFEAIFPELVRRFALGGADFIVNITNDAWFGKTAAPYQHFNMAVLRAVENRRVLVRAANTGITGVISPEGVVEARTEIFTRGCLVRDVPIAKKKSFYTLHGDVFAYACALAGLVFLVSIPARPGYNNKKRKAESGPGNKERK